MSFGEFQLALKQMSYVENTSLSLKNVCVGEYQLSFKDVPCGEYQLVFLNFSVADNTSLSFNKCEEEEILTF